MQVVRSPHAHAVIERIDAAAARAMPGVLGVYTATDLAEAGTAAVHSAGRDSGR